jgi:hypothetical protein
MDTELGNPVTQTKQINYWPDISSAETWDTYHIALAEVTRVFSESGRTRVQIQIRRQFSTGPIGESITAPLDHYWFGMDVFDRAELNTGDWVVVYYRKAESTPRIVTQKLDVPPDESDLVRGLADIARLRSGTDDMSALLDAALDANAIISQYALRQLLSWPETPRQPEVRARLRAVREDQARPPETRLMASRLAARIEQGTESSDAELAWVESAFIRASATDWTALSPFTERLIDLDRRPEVIHFLTGVAVDPDQRKPVRIAAYAAFQDPRLFSFDHPDSASAEIFAASATMLSDPDPEFRMAGASLLHALSTRMAEPSRADYVARGRAAIQERRQLEADPLVSHHLESSVSLFDQASRG